MELRTCQIPIEKGQFINILISLLNHLQIRSLFYFSLVCFAPIKARTSSVSKRCIVLEKITLCKRSFSDGMGQKYFEDGLIWWDFFRRIASHKTEDTGLSYFMRSPAQYVPKLLFSGIHYLFHIIIHLQIEHLLIDLIIL